MWLRFDGAFLRVEGPGYRVENLKCHGLLTNGVLTRGYGLPEFSVDRVGAVSPRSPAGEPSVSAALFVAWVICRLTSFFLRSPAAKP